MLYLRDGKLQTKFKINLAKLGTLKPMDKAQSLYVSTGQGNPNAIFARWEITNQIQNKSRKAGNSKTYGLSTKFVRVDWAREPKCYVCAMGNYKPHLNVNLMKFSILAKQEN